MFWIGIAVGVLATIGFLLAEHLISQITRHQRARLAGKYSSVVSWIINPFGHRAVKERSGSGLVTSRLEVQSPQQRGGR